MPDTTRTLIRYKNRARALVTVTERNPAPGSLIIRFTAECAGCLDSLGGDDSRSLLRDARKWADAHAAECRALPQPDEQV